MPLNYVTLTGKIPGGGGAVAWLALSGWTPAAADSLFFPPKHDPVTLAPDGSFSVPGLLANDSSDIAAGTYWTLTIRGIDGVPSSSWNFFLNYAQGAVQDVSGLAMVSSPPPAVPYMPVPAGEAEQGYVPVATGDGQASAWGPGGGGGSGTVTDVSGGTANGFTVGVASPATTPAVSVKLGFTSGLVKAGTGGAASAATAGTDYLAPNGSGAALTGITATQAGADASGAAAAAQAAAEAASDPSGSAAAVLASSLQKSSNLGDLANAGTARTNLALGSAATHASTDFDAAGAAATAQANAEAASLPVTDDLSAIATANATAGNVAMNSHKLTGLANGSASGDSAAFGQTPAGGSTATIGQGGTGQVTQQAALDAIAGAVTSGLVLRGNGSHVALAAIQAGDVPTLNQNTSGTAANLSGTPAVPNGTTATTQAAADSSTKLATTAYADNSASTAAGSKLAKSANLSDIANAATALANLGLPTPTTQNQVPVSNSSDQWTLAAAGTVGGNTYNAGWTVGASDLGGEALYTGTSAGAATIPMGLTTVIGATFAARQDSSGTLTIAGGSGVTVFGATATTGQYQTVFARQVATDTWVVTASTDVLAGAAGYWGYYGWTCDPMMSGNAIKPGQGQLVLCRFRAARSGVIGHIGYAILAAGSALTSGENWMGVYDTGQTTAGTITLIGSTADQTTNFGTTGSISAAIASGTPTVTAGQDYFAAVLSNATTRPQIVGPLGNALAGPAVNLGLSGIGLRLANGPTTYTTLPATVTGSSLTGTSTTNVDALALVLAP